MENSKARMLIRPKQSANNVYQLYIYDEVTAKGHMDWSTWEYVESKTSAKYFKEQLEAIPDNATIELYVNSTGGYASEGTAIYNQLARHKARKIGYVDGIAYSVASLILMACDHIVMGLGTSMLVHEMWASVAGNAEELRQAADSLDKLMESNRQVYLSRCNLTEEELIALMKEERPLTPKECLEMGLIDEISQQTGNHEEDGDAGTVPDNDFGDDEKQEQIKQYIAAMLHKECKAAMQALQKEPLVPEKTNMEAYNFFNQFKED